VSSMSAFNSSLKDTQEYQFSVSPATLLSIPH